MGNYGKAAVRAVHLYITGPAKDPEQAWTEAICTLTSKASCQKKGCPRDAFLGLCEAGLVKGIPSGHYTDSKENKGYALDAVRILKRGASFAITQTGLWRMVVKESKCHNGQMDVVIGLWSDGLII